MFGAVFYLFNRTSGESSFIMGKNRIVGTKLNIKSIPQLELNGILLGVETALDIYNELCSEVCMVPIEVVDIKIFSDSLVALNWIQNFSCRKQKMNKVSVFVKIGLEKISNICNNKSMEFQYIADQQNPSDAITRPFSCKQFSQTNYLTGLSQQELAELEDGDFAKVVVPNTLTAEVLSCIIMEFSLFPLLRFTEFNVKS